MQIPFVSLQGQYEQIADEVRAAIDDVFRRSHFVLGEHVRLFEEELAASCGAAYGVGVGSGTEALHLALRAVGVKPGDEVITVGNVWVPTACAIAAAGAVPVFVDVDPDTCNMAVEAVGARITARTAAIVPVHLYGQTVDMDPLLAVARAAGVPVVEDACQAHGSEYKGRRAGALGDAACFSFYPTKNLGAYGDGGAVVTRDEGLARAVRTLRNYGEGDRRYRSEVVGVNSRLDELQAAVLRAKLPRLDAWNAARRAHAALYRDRLAGADVVIPTEREWARSNYHLFVVRSKHRDELAAWLGQHGVGTAVHYPVPVHLQPAFAHLGQAEGSLPETERACREVLSLPIFPELRPAQIERVAEVIAAFRPGAKETSG